MPDVRKIKHKIYMRTQSSSGAKTASVYRNLIKQAILITLRSEQVAITCVINVLITDDKGIRKYNQQYRDVDRVTDVLSFPMQEFKQACWLGIEEMEIDLDTGMLPLGDIVISTQRAKQQAGKHRISLEQETAHLIIHSTLHLLGYDHNNNKNENIMQSKEGALLKDMGYL